MKKDILTRALKTFVQAFFGVLIPEACAILNGGFTDISAFWKAITPFLAAALSAGISAVWNVILDNAKNKEAEDNG